MLSCCPAHRPAVPRATRAAFTRSQTLVVSSHCPPSLRRDSWSLEDFEVKAQMYKGKISLVYHVVDKRSGLSLALKMYKRCKLNEIERRQVSREIRLHSDLDHPSIIKLYAAWKDRAFVFMALELALAVSKHTQQEKAPHCPWP